MFLKLFSIFCKVLIICLVYVSWIKQYKVKKLKKLKGDSNFVTNWPRCLPYRRPTFVFWVVEVCRLGLEALWHLSPPLLILETVTLTEQEFIEV